MGDHIIFRRFKMYTEIENQEIGIATLLYNEDETPLCAHFKPTMDIKMGSREILEMADQVDCTGKDHEILNQANGVFATWFQRMNDVELADRSQYEIAAEFIKPCERWENGKIKGCNIRFVFKHL